MPICRGNIQTSPIRSTRDGGRHCNAHRETAARRQNPSVRNASRQHKVSVGTAIQAYLALENRGLVEARPKSGFFVRFQARRLLEPQTSRPSLRATSIDSSTLLTRYCAVTQSDVVQLGAGSPSTSLLPVQKLNRILAAVARRTGASALEYDMPPGCLTLRRVLARRRSIGA